MEKDISDFVAKRCEKALLQSEEYLETERASDQDETQALAEIICYKQGFLDAVE